MEDLNEMKLVSREFAPNNKVYTSENLKIPRGKGETSTNNRNRDDGFLLMPQVHERYKIPGYALKNPSGIFLSLLTTFQLPPSLSTSGAPMASGEGGAQRPWSGVPRGCLTRAVFFVGNNPTLHALFKEIIREDIISKLPYICMF